MKTKDKAELRDEYLRWLEPQLKDEEATTKSYWQLLNMMFEKEYVKGNVPMDNNRLVDGLDLRTEFAHANRRPLRIREEFGPCSFAEVLIALSRKMAFTAGGEAPGWAWTLLDNIDLQRASDPLSRAKRDKIERTMDVVMGRTYSPDGSGGFFPLAWPDDDQTTIELWYQMNSYIEELHPEY